VSEIVRRAVDAWIEKTEPLAERQQKKRIPTFHGGRITIRGEDMREIAYQDRTGLSE